MNIDFAQVVTAEVQAAAGMAAARSVAQGQVLAAITALTEAMTGPVPLAEMLCWPAKEAAARACADGTASAAETAQIEGEAAMTGEDAAMLARRILKNAETYRAAIATLTGLRRAAEAAIEEAHDVAEVDGAVSGALEKLGSLVQSPTN